MKNILLIIVAFTLSVSCAVDVISKTDATLKFNYATTKPFNKQTDGKL